MSLRRGQRRICSGTTQNTTAKITVQHGLVYQKIVKSYGTETAQKYLVANTEAFEKYAKLCKKIDCDYETKDNYLYSIYDRKKLENEMTALERIGCKADLCDSISIPIQSVGAVRILNQAQFHPLKFLSAISGGLNIYENTFVKEMIGNTAVTNHGKLYADKVIAATHFPFINKHGSYFLKLYQHRSYMIVLENAQKVNGMYVDESRTGMSFRNYNNFLLIGGGGERTGKIGGNWTELRNFAKEHYPNAKERYFWAAQDCMSLDDIPYIGSYSRSTADFYVASGFNKWGITGAMVSAIILSDMIAGKSRDYADIFNPSRSIIKPQLFVNGYEAVKNLLSISDKRCPHLGCALKWNSVEHSWDCQCHGSRFAENGKVLDNPANGNLSKKSKNGCTKESFKCTKTEDGCTKGSFKCTKTEDGCTKGGFKCTKIQNGCTKDGLKCTKTQKGCTKGGFKCTKTQKGCTKELVFGAFLFDIREIVSQIALCWI